MFIYIIGAIAATILYFVHGFFTTKELVNIMGSASILLNEKEMTPLKSSSDAKILRSYLKKTELNHTEQLFTLFLIDVCLIFVLTAFNVDPFLTLLISTLISYSFLFIKTLLLERRVLQFIDVASTY